MIKERVPERVLKAAQSLDTDPRFEVIVAWLRDSLDATRRENDTAEGINLTINQGCARTLVKLITVFDSEGKAP
jgi:hypothetical protein